MASVVSSVYRAVWRWHFYAGLLILPVLIILAVTGGIYLFERDITRLVYRDWIERPVQTSAPASAETLQRAVESALGGKLIQITMPDRPGHSVQALVRVATGEVRHVYADTHDARVLGSHEFGGLMRVVAQVHSLSLFGTWANALVEIAAGWAVIMVFTGTYLWWPRNGTAGAVTIRGRPSQRLFWRDLHAVVGVIVGALIVFLALTGLPWSYFWGEQAHGWVAKQGLGSPQAPAEVTPFFMLGTPATPDSHAEHAAHQPAPPVPWALDGVTPPQSHDHSGHVIGLNAAIAQFEALGMSKPYGVQPPEGPRGAYAATHIGDQVENTRLVYLDQHTGKIIGDIRYADYGVGAKAIEWGISVHQGRQYGTVNRYVMLLGCFGIIALAASSIVMWWKRRPQGSLGVPPMPESRKVGMIVLGIIASASLFFPLTGLSLLAALMIDGAFAVFARRRSTRSASSY